MNKNEALELLRRTPVFWSRLGFCYDPPILDDKGEPLVFNSDFSYQLKVHDDFSDAGIKIHTSIMHSGWVGVDKYDYSLTDKVLKAVFQSGKAVYYIPRIKLNVPIEWCRENPTEVWVYENGPKTVEEIRELVGTPKHDYLGYDSKVGYYNANGWQDPRPNLGGVISNQSFSSGKWLNDAGEALKRLINHLEESEYGDRILAYHICFGASGESMPWGRQSGKFGDYGITNTANFKEWATVKYGTFEEAVKIWGDTNGDIIPPSFLREKQHNCSSDFYKNELLDKWSIDYDEYMSIVNADAISYFAKIVKENTNDKPVGTFYGYILYMTRTAYAGHLAFEKLLSDPNIDFFAAPKKYSRSFPGEPGGVMAPAVTVNRDKLWLDECDNRTHLTVGDSNNNASNAEETYIVQLRETCKNISYNSGLWYMDLGGGWYDDVGIMNNIAKLVSSFEKINTKKHKSVAEIVIVVDEKSVMLTHPSVIQGIDDMISNIMLCGAPVDIIYSFDYDRADFSSAKAVVLITPLCLNNDYIDILKTKMSENASLIIVGKSAYDCGMTLVDSGNANFPEFYIESSATSFKSLIERNARSVCGCLRDDELLISTHSLTVSELRSIFEFCKVDFYAPEECTVYADNRIVSFFARKDIEFVPSVLQNGTFRNFMSGEMYNRGSSVILKAKDGFAFIRE